MIAPRVLASLWAAVILGLHSIPRYRLDQIPGVEDLVRSSGPDKVVHGALFAVLGVLWSRCLPRHPVVVLAAGIAYGAALEFYQGRLVSGRAGSPEDVFADAVGVVIGVALAAWSRHRGRGRGRVA